jgi:hypothetical protein
MFNAAIKIPGKWIRKEDEGNQALDSLRVIEGAIGSYLRDSSRIYTHEPE